MCSGPRKVNTPPPATNTRTMVDDNEHNFVDYPSLLLELSACNDLSAFKTAVGTADGTFSAAAVAPWYCRPLGAAARMGFADRTPLMIAALYGSNDVLRYIIDQFPGEVNRCSTTDGATALHLAAAGGCPGSLVTVKILLDASADLEAVDISGRRPGDVVAKQTVKSLETVLKSSSPSPSRASSPATPREGSDEKKKEYPPDLTLPDIKNGIYGTDEFRMYTFKVKPCSRAYSHDWTECPFVHPGENARRRDPRKYLYSCVPCPEFRKGSCVKGDGCEYAHGVFECWLHPAQYRTRLCKDEVGCNRRVCFFAHKPEELRSVNPTAASVNAGLVLSSPRSAGVSSLDMAAALMLSSSPMSPSAAAVSSAMGSPGVWMNQPPALNLSSSRLKASMSARDMEVDFELLGLEGYQQKLIDEIQAAAASSPRANWPSSTPMAGASRAADYSNLFGSQLANPSLTQQLLSGYSGNVNLPSSPTLNSSASSFGLDHSMAKAMMNPSSPSLNSSTSSFGLDHSMAKAIMNSRSAAFAKRSQSFCDRGAVARLPSGLSASPATPTIGMSDWGSPGGKLDWGVQGEELNKLRKSSSFVYRNNQNGFGGGRSGSPPKPPATFEEPDLSWVQSLVKDGPANAPVARGSFDQQKMQQYQLNGAGSDFLAADMYGPWGDEQLVA